MFLDRIIEMLGQTQWDGYPGRVGWRRESQEISLQIKIPGKSLSVLSSTLNLDCGKSCTAGQTWGWDDL